MERTAANHVYDAMKEGSPVDKSIPVHPTHSRTVTIRALLSAGGMLLGFAASWAGSHWSIPILVTAGVIIFALFLLGFFAVGALIDYAKCPECSRELTQGWNEKTQTSTGLFECAHCQKRWRTPATWSAHG
jgi:hypothetical protein